MSGYKLNSIMLSFYNQGSVTKSAFPTNSQSRLVSAVFYGVLGPPLPRGVPEATQEASRKPLKGAVSAQKAFSGSQTEAREFLMETERKVFLYWGVKWFALQANFDSFTKRKQKKIESLARPGNYSFAESNFVLVKFSFSSLSCYYANTLIKRDKAQSFCPRIFMTIYEDGIFDGHKN